MIATNVECIFVTAMSLAFKFNGKKSYCLSLGKLANVDFDPMLLANQWIARCQSNKYLGVHLLCGKGLSFDITPIKFPFYAACDNIIFSFSWC